MMMTSNAMGNPALKVLRSLEDDHGQWRKCDCDTMPPVALRRGLGPHASCISYVTTAEVVRIRVQHFGVEAGLWNAHLILEPHHRSEIAAHQQKIRGVFGAPDGPADGVLPI